MSSQDADDLSQTPSPDNLVIVGGDKTSNEQSLPPYPSLQVQFPSITKKVQYFFLVLHNAFNVFLFIYIYFFIPDVHIPLLLQLFGHKFRINAAISGCSFANVEFNNIYVWHCTRPVSRCNWVRLWSPVICENITNITKNIFLYPFFRKTWGKNRSEKI